VNRHRRVREAGDAGLLAEAQAGGLGPAQAVAAEDSWQYLWSTAERVLSEEETTALWLHYVEDLPAAEIAVVLDRSRSAVKTMLFRARKKLLPFVEEVSHV
jgi:DNA-directed RNA polymerase specialized sigma24 family protein